MICMFVCFLQKAEKKKDQGEYRCEAENQYGKVKAEGIVEVRGE